MIEEVIFVLVLGTILGEVVCVPIPKTASGVPTSHLVSSVVVEVLELLRDQG